MDRRRAVAPDSVNTAMARMSISSAACAIDSQMDSGTVRAWARVRGVYSPGSSRICASVSSTIFAIIRTASTGYLPAPDSADSIPASVPS